MMQQKAMIWLVPSNAPGIADWNLLAIAQAFGSSLRRVDERREPAPNR